MPDFADPFSGTVPERKLTHEELIRAIRLDIAAEYEAVHLNMAHAEAIDNPLAKNVLIDIANEEREHIGEFQRLLELLTGDEDEWMSHGREEVNEVADKVGMKGASKAASYSTTDGAGPTGGSLREE
jgi:rubrerythrin